MKKQSNLNNKVLIKYLRDKKMQELNIQQKYSKLDDETKKLINLVICNELDNETIKTIKTKQLNNNKQNKDWELEK